MKTKVLTLIALCLLTTGIIHSQGQLSILKGIHPSGRIYDGAFGTHTGLQYSILADNDMTYGVVAQYSRFVPDHSAPAAQVSSFNGFASYPVLGTERIRPYVKFELGAAYASTNRSLEARATSPDTRPANFVSAQIAPAIGTQFLLTGSIVMQVEYKKNIQYANALVANGDYNYSTLDLGVTYKFHRAQNKNRFYTRSLPRCSYRRGGTSSCFSFN
jgi:hypothetical protein